MTTIDLGRIFFDDGSLDEQTVEHYCRKIRNGEPLEEIVVYTAPNGKYSIVDGACD
jgi:hypothetical protein